MAITQVGARRIRGISLGILRSADVPERNVRDFGPSAISAIRALRDELRARLDRNEDYRAWKALDETLRQLDPPTLPKAMDFLASTRANGVDFDDKSLSRPSSNGPMTPAPSALRR
jgi:hypothetical protein